MTYGAICPQPLWRTDNPIMRMIAWADDRFQDEDCLNLNVWTPSIDRGAKLPVLVWLHGGAFSAGSSRENPGYEGLNLSRRGAVVVSVNHRIGALGFLDLSASGGRFDRSANAGMLDLVAALRWVNENIERFGGDPARVTIFGQSGGGAKVSTLMAMPGANGLFHRAVVMSGSPRSFAKSEATRKLAAALADAAKVPPGDAAALQQVDVARLLAAGQDAIRSSAGTGLRLGWQPVLHSEDLPVDWTESAPAQSAHIPLLVGSVRDEFRPIGVAEPMSDADLNAQLTKRFGDKTPAVIASLRTAFPNATAADLSAAAGGQTWRQSAVTQATKQHVAGKASVFHYFYLMPSPLLDGGVGVPHGTDVDMFFDNVEHQPGLTGRTPAAFDLADRMSGALVAFADCGRPAYGNVTWTAFDPERVNTMMFDARTRMVDDPAGEARRIIASVQTGPFG